MTVDLVSSGQKELDEHLAELITELGACLEPFKDGHPALTEQVFTLVTHESDFYLPNRVDVRVAAHTLSPLTLNNAQVELVVSRERESAVVSYGLYNMLSAQRPSLAQCVIMGPKRVAELFLKPGASVDDEGTAMGIRNIEGVITLVKRVAA